MNIFGLLDLNFARHSACPNGLAAGIDLELAVDRLDVIADRERRDAEGSAGSLVALASGERPQQFRLTLRQTLHGRIDVDETGCEAGHPQRDLGHNAWWRGMFVFRPSAQSGQGVGPVAAILTFYGPHAGRSRGGENRAIIYLTKQPLLLRAMGSYASLILCPRSFKKVSSFVNLTTKLTWVFCEFFWNLYVLGYLPVYCKKLLSANRIFSRCVYVDGIRFRSPGVLAA